MDYQSSKNHSLSNSLSSSTNLRILIDKVISFLPDIYSLEFEIAQFHFQRYVLDSFRNAQDSSEEGFFIDELFVTISLAQLNQNTFHYLILLASLLDVDLGDKVSKANRIARDLANIQLDPNPLIYKLLKKILLWLNKTLQNSIQFIINPLLAMGWSFCCTTEYDKKISGLLLIRLFMKNFSIYLENQHSQIQDIIIENVKSHTAEVRIATLKFLKSYLSFATSSYDIIQLCGKLNLTLNKDNWMFFQGAIEASELIIKYHQQLTSCFILNEIPFKLFQEKDTDALIAACRVIPFSLKTGRALFNNKEIEHIFHIYISLLTKKSMIKKQVFVSLGKILFLLESIENPKLLSLVQKFHSLVEDFIDSSSSIFALLAIDSIIPAKYVKDEVAIFSKKKLTALVILGLNQFMLAHPEFEMQIQSQIFQIACSIILNNSSPPEMTKLAFDSLIQMKIKSSFLKISLVIQMLSQLSNPNYDVRESAANFALFYQEAIDTTEISQIILSSVVTEPNQKLRIKMIKGVKFTSNVEIISLLHLLLHDSNRQIRKEALNSLSKNSNDSLTDQILTDFLLEKIPNDKELMTKEGIECFLIVSSHIENTESIIIPFSKFLIVHLIGENRKLPSSAFKLLSQIIKFSPNDVDIDRLVWHISQSLNVFSSKKRLDACLDLIHSAMKCTNLMEEIYNKHLQLFVNLLSISQLSDTSVSRNKLIRVLAFIGAIKSTIVQSLVSDSQDQKKKNDVETAQFFISQADNIDPYQSLSYASVGVALSNLLSILQDSSLTALHTATIESFLIILKCYRSIGRNLESFLLKQINNLVINGNPSTVSLLLTNMPALISVLDTSFSPLVPHVVDFICQKWNILDKSLLIRISEWMMMYVSDDFRPYLPRVVSVFLRDFNSYDEKIVDGIVSAFVSFNESIEDVAHIAYPALLDWILYNSRSTNACNEILHKTKLIFVSGGVSKYSSLIVRMAVLTAQLNGQLHMRLLEILSVVAFQTGESFLLYLPRIKSVIDITIYPLFCSIIKSLTHSLSFEPDAIALTQHSLVQKVPRKHNSSFSNVTKNSQTQFSIKIPSKDWDKGQWETWCSETFSTIIRSNSSRAISACYLLAERHTPLRDAIYPLAFLLTYILHLNENIRTMDGMKLLKSVMEVVFSSQNVPQSIMRHFLTVIELMEIIGSQIPIAKKMIADAAVKCGLYAQALRTTEGLFEQRSDSEIAEQLILLNQKLGFKLSASGIFQFAKRRGIRISRATLSESLGLWNDALLCYEERQADNNSNDDSILNRKMRCYQKLLKFDELKKASSGTGCFYEAVASWSLFDYENFVKIVENYTKKSDSNQAVNEYSFYQAIYLIMKDDYEGAKQIINSLLDQPKGIFPIISEDYLRVITEFSTTSNVSMLLEVIRYKKMQHLKNSPSPLERERAKLEMDRITRCWSLRFNKLTEETVILFDFLTLEALVLNQSEMKDHWLKFIQIAISQSYFSIAQSVSGYLKNSIDEHFLNELKILDCDLLWAQGKKSEAIIELTKLGEVSDRSLHQQIELSLIGYLLNQEQLEEAYNHLQNIPKNDIILDIKYSILWTRVNALLFQSTNNQKYLLESFKSMLMNISRIESNPLTLALQVLSILFRKGNHEIYQIFSEKVDSIPVGCWIEAIPQIIARLSSPVDELRVLLVDLIYKIGVEHPHAVLYPLLVPFKSDNIERRTIASSLFDRLRLMFQKIVDGVVLLADELMRVAVSWLEIAQTQMDKASRAYVNGNDVDEMIKHLLPLQEIVKKVPETFYEVSFLSQFGQHLQTAINWLDIYKETKDDRAIHQIWQHLAAVFNKVKPVVEAMNTIPLVDISSKLANMQNAEISVPGSYHPNESLVTITSFGSKIKLIKSKQRPRKLSIWGSNGKKFTFLLKAHEDTRLDERVMQLFGYINSLIDQSSYPLKTCLSIVTYKVIPLTCEVGLIGWVPDCSTLFEILRAYRQKNNVQLEIEFLNLNRIAPNYKSMPISEKVVAFEKGLAANNGNDLKQILLDNASDSQDWLERRSTYSASLASTSMAGYILGLGDRHFDNIMMKSKSAKLVHIDFGDCFEVAMHRDNYPEKVPIRLTRLLVNALEVSKIEGTFRSCCENVMSLMRMNDESIMSLLEAFIYDPLLQWCDNKNDDQGTAVAIVDRIKDKLSGNDFDKDHQLSVQEQVEALINQATDISNLCDMFKGWSPWW